MRVAAKSTKGKGRLWKKGQSSSSNPETMTFREKAKLQRQMNLINAAIGTTGTSESIFVENLNKTSVEDVKKKLAIEDMKKRKQQRVWIKGDTGADGDTDDNNGVADDDVLDLMSKASISRKILKANPFKKPKPVLEEIDGFPIAPDGRIIITDPEDEKRKEKREEKRGLKRKRDSDDQQTTESSIFETNKDSEDDDEDDEDTHGPVAKYRHGGKGIHRIPVKKSKLDTEKSTGDSDVNPGSQFKSKKAGGDMKKKNAKLDPYAYVPLNRSVLNKRKKQKFSGQFKHLMTAAKKGAVTGKKMRSKLTKHK